MLNQLTCCPASAALGAVYAARGSLDGYAADITAFKYGDLLFGLGPVLSLRLTTAAAAELARCLNEAVAAVSGGAQ